MTKTIGIVGGGQLGRMLTQAANSLGYGVIVVNPGPNSPASQVGAEEIVGDLYDEAVLRKLAERADVITVEIEHLNAAALEAIAKDGVPVYPSPQTIRVIQDKYQQKVFLAKAGIPVADFREVTSIKEALEALADYGGKMLLKTRYGAYDGRGNALVSSESALTEAWSQFDGQKLYAEKFVSFDKELAVMVARATNGSIKPYPVTETIHERNICIETRTPAQVPASASKKAENLALRVAEYLEGAGVFGIEMFLAENGDVVVNEVAPRVHNSGHYTIEACETSQFEQHIRAITGMPLGDTSLKVPAAVMINILGERNGETKVVGLEKALALPDTHFHLYGKSPTKVDRKMGHLTATGKDEQAALEQARKARELISI